MASKKQEILGKKTEFASIPEDAENAQLLPDNQTIIYTIKNNFFVNINGKTLKITDDQNENIINGQSVHRNEFGIDGGIFAAPNFQKLHFTEWIKAWLLTTQSSIGA